MTVHPIRPQDLAEDAVQLARRWVTEAATIPVDASAARDRKSVV